FSALKGDADLAMPMICAPSDSLTIKEVREAEGTDRNAIAVEWEFATSLAAAVAGAEIICVRHPDTVGRLKAAITSLKARTGV
ncbi:MAG: acetyl-CoA synthase, partial [Methanoregula sp.]